MALIGISPSAARAAEQAAPASAATIQMLADVALIDAECRNVRVVFGKAFQASEADGVHVSDVMPVGALRPSFEAAYRVRFTQTSHDGLCTDVVNLYAAKLPGLFTPP